MAKDTRHDMVRQLPSVDRLLGERRLKELSGGISRSVVVQAARQTIDALRAKILDGWTPPPEELSADRIAAEASALALKLSMPSIRRVINATGIVLHTGLGRAVLPEAARKALEAVASGHSNLEIDMDTGARGSRRTHYSRLLADLCGAEAGFAVNNNAGAVLLALNTLADGREVIVSRGQLIEIGGSFRLPDIMARAGARLVEVGTTNRTRIGDYEAAITDETALLLRAHPSNFRVVGFTEDVPIRELVPLGRRYGIPIMEDVGSGALVDMSQFGLQGEPLVQDSIKAGADVVTFSGDKLLGGPQAGLIVGRKDIVDSMAKNPLARALRVDKLTVAALESTLKLYADPETLPSAIPTLRYITRLPADIERAARRLRRLVLKQCRHRVNMQIIDGFSEVGGGSLPGERLPTRLLALSSSGISAMEIARAFRMAEPPVIGRVGEDRCLLDLRTVEDEEIPQIARAAVQIFSS
jgi:L-seryl-tRNA(Ser) seleniumtransferase